MKGELDVRFAWVLDGEYLAFAVHVRNCTPKLRRNFSTPRFNFNLYKVSDYFRFMNTSREGADHMCWYCMKTVRLDTASAEEINNSKFQKCQECKIARYCSSTCQKRHWSSHKYECAKLRTGVYDG